MIRKFLVVGRSMFLSSTKVDDEGANLTSLDLLLPLETLWKMTKLLDESNYMISNQDSYADIVQVYKRVYQLAVPYTIYESDRIFILKKIAQTANTS